MNFSMRAWCILAVCAGAAQARGWAFPTAAQESSESVRIDTKVRFLDDGASDKSVSTSTTLDITKRGDVQSDEVPFRQPTTTDGFYNRPPGAGRFPVRVVADHEAYRVNGQAVYSVQANKNANDGTVDSIQYCKCVSTPDCNPRRESAEVCGAGKYLCCYKRPNKVQQLNSEYFNEIDDERPMLFPGKENNAGPFPPPPSGAQGDAFRPGHGGEFFDFGAVDARPNKPVLVGPGGPTGHIGPQQQSNRPVLVGPDGPTGVIGPAPVNENIVASAAAQRGVLVGPGGPTGIIGPYNQRPGLLAGPRGPSGVVGPNRSRGVLVGPGGPTGIIGPGYGRQSGPGLLVGPGGPTGTIGPGRQLLVGPGGPTGRIGPQRYFVSETNILKSVLSTSSSTSKPEQMVENKNETEFSRSLADGGPVHPRDDDGTDLPDHATLATNTTTHSNHQRVRRGGCSRGCDNSPAVSPVPPHKRKGFRVKLPNKPTPKRQRPTHKKTGCSRPGGGCQSAPRAPLQTTTAAPKARRVMGIEEFHPKRPKPTPALPLLRKRPGLRGGDDEGGEDFLGQLFSYVLSAYMEDMKGDKTTEKHDRDIYGEIIITTKAPTTVKPSIFRKIPIFLAFLKIIKAMIVFGIM